MKTANNKNRQSIASAKLLNNKIPPSACSSVISYILYPILSARLFSKEPIIYDAVNTEIKTLHQDEEVQKPLTECKKSHDYRTW